jgi:hypothetical protein
MYSSGLLTQNPTNKIAPEIVAKNHVAMVVKHRKIHIKVAKIIFIWISFLG